MTQNELEILEAFALGYSLSGTEQHREVFTGIPFRNWWGPLREHARILQSYPKVNSEDAKNLVCMLGLDPEEKSKLVKRIIDTLAEEHRKLSIARIPAMIETLAASLRNNPLSKDMKDHLTSKLKDLEEIKVKLEEAKREYEPIRLAESA